MLGQISTVVAACVASSAVYAAPQLGTNGVGMSACAKFNKVLAADPHWTKENYLSWAQGFMAGANMAEANPQSRTSDVNAISVDDQWEHLKAYCVHQPDMAFAQGVWNLYLSLPPGPRKIPSP